MLVTFRCRRFASVTLFGDIAVQLIKMMGHSGTIPGALGAQELPDALAKLTAALNKQAAAENATPPSADEDEVQAEPAVDLSRRAYPLIELLKAAIKEQCEVMWEG